MQVKKARREKLYAAIGMIGASGSGKTLSSLLIAYGMMKEKYPELKEDEIWGKIGMLDTEHKRSLIYADMERAGIRIGEFLHIDFQAPFSAENYRNGVDLLKKAGAEVIIIDSLSHAWEGSGGFLELQQQFGGNFQAWNKVKPHLQDFIKTLTQQEVHIIGSMRTKQEYTTETNEIGKIQIRKLGLKPIQKDDLEYEFQVNFNIDEFHNAACSKDNSGLFEGTFRITPEIGAKLYKWLEKGVDILAEILQKRQEMISDINDLTKKFETLVTFVESLEKKASKKLDEFPVKLLEKALLLVNEEAEKLGGKENVI